MELHKKLARLRQEKGWSQEKTAAELGVSRQAVQKWESGAGVPELDNLIRLAQCFRVSLDALVLDKDMRMKQELHQDALIQPDYASQDPCEAYGELMVEYRQCMDEGKALAELETLFQAVDALPAGQDSGASPGKAAGEKACAGESRAAGEHPWGMAGPGLRLPAGEACGGLAHRPAASVS